MYTMKMYFAVLVSVLCIVFIPSYSYSIQINNSQFTALNTAFGNANTGDTITYGFTDGTEFGKLNQIFLSKTDLTLQGSGGNRSALDALLAKMPDWAANNTLPTDFTAQLSAAIAQAASGMTTLRPTNNTARISALFQNTNNAGANFTVNNIHFDGFTFEYGGEIQGGGIIGAVSSIETDSTIGTVSNSIFENININVAGNLLGGGIIGAYVNYDQGNNAIIGNINGTIISNINVNSVGAIRGGGVIGTLSSNRNDNATIGLITNSIFNDISIETNSALEGGGVIGAFSGSDGVNGGEATIGDISDTIISDISIEASTDIKGGGIIGAYGNANSIANEPNTTSSEINNISDTILSDINVNAGGNIQGGGIIGAYSNAKQYGTSNTSGSAQLGYISRTSISNMLVEAGGNIQGGGVIGAYSNLTGTGSATATIDDISNSTFDNIIIKADGDIQGGGIIGAFSSASSAATIGDISTTSITNSTISAGGNIWGGLVYVQNAKDADGMTITDSSFIGNTATASGAGKVYGMVSFDTSHVNTTNAQNVHLIATAGNQTIFLNNATTSGSSESNNSLFFGNIQGTSGSTVNASLTISPEAGGTVALYDPIKVAMTSGKTFTMDIASSQAKGTGEFIWGGKNDIVTTGTNSTINFGANSNTTLYNDFSLDGTSTNIDVHFKDTSTVNMGIDRFLIPSSPSTTYLFSGNMDIAIEPTAKLGLSMQAGAPLNINGKTVIIIDIDNNITGSFANINDTIAVNQGAFLTYDSLVDINGGKVNVRITSDAKTQAQAKVPAEMQAASMAMLNQGADLLSTAGLDNAMMATANTASKQVSEDEQIIGGRATPIAAFNAFGGGKSRYATGSYADIRAFSFVSGFAKRTNFTSDSNLLYGAFFEYGHSDVDTKNTFANHTVTADGESEYYGAGLFARYNYNPEFYAEASLRIGSNEISQNSNDYDYAGSLGQDIGYDTSSMYFGTHLGLGYVLKLGDAHTFDMYTKYFFTHQGGDTATFNASFFEFFEFDDINSHRTRLGTRYSYIINDTFTPYIGAAWEYEFGGDAKSSVYGLTAGTPTLEGSTGVFELGINMNSDDSHFPLSVDFGIETYLGTREGVSGKAQIKYVF